jgi:hypothetical protein
VIFRVGSFERGSRNKCETYETDEATGVVFHDCVLCFGRRARLRQ